MMSIFSLIKQGIVMEKVLKTLLNIVLYMNSNHQNDFQVNYNADLNALRLLNTTHEQKSNG